MSKFLFETEIYWMPWVKQEYNVPDKLPNIIVNALEHRKAFAKFCDIVMENESITISKDDIRVCYDVDADCMYYRIDCALDDNPSVSATMEVGIWDVRTPPFYPGRDEKYV